MLTISIPHAGGPHIVHAKGATERVIDMCGWCWNGKENVRMTAEVAVMDLNTKMAALGERVLAFADLTFLEGQFPADYEFNVESNEPNFPMGDLTTSAFSGMTR